MVLPRSARIGKRIAVGLGGLAILLGVILAPALLPSPGFREWVREGRPIRRLDPREVEMHEAWNLLDAGSDRDIVRLLKKPRPEVFFIPRWVYYGRYPLEPACRLIQEIGPRNLARISRDAFERGELTEEEILGLCNRSIPGWAEAMKAMRKEDPPQEIRSLDDLPRFIDSVERCLEEVYG